MESFGNDNLERHACQDRTARVARGNGYRGDGRPSGNNANYSPPSHAPSLSLARGFGSRGDTAFNFIVDFQNCSKIHVLYSPANTVQLGVPPLILAGSPPKRTPAKVGGVPTIFSRTLGGKRANVSGGTPGTLLNLNQLYDIASLHPGLRIMWE